MADLAIILTVRSDSERLKDKCFSTIRKKPLIHWIIKRLQKIENSQVILATTHLESDNRLAALADKMKIPCYRGDSRDVVARVDNAMRMFAPDCKLVLRALGDMPFIGVEIVDRAVQVLLKHPAKEAFCWHLPPDIWPIYGSREFPYSRSGWNKIARRSFDSEQKEHTDMFFHQNRRSFNILYHAPPKQIYFRPHYRLEIDYKEDITLVQAVADKIGMFKPLPQVIKHLDENPEVMKLNQGQVELTGPMISYHYQQHRIWKSLLKGQPELDWNDRWWRPLSPEQAPVFCHRGHLLGYEQHGILYTRDGEVQLESGKIKCSAADCGASRIWKFPTPRSG